MEGNQVFPFRAISEYRLLPRTIARVSGISSIQKIAATKCMCRTKSRDKKWNIAIAELQFDYLDLDLHEVQC